MRHAETLLVPVLMLSDYYLTVVGAVLKERGYSQHFRSPHYELNPLWQKEIQAKRWLNPRHLLSTVLLTAALLGISAANLVPDYLVEGLLGYFFALYGSVVGKHLGNILTFHYLVRHPGELTGEVTIAHAMSLSLSMYQYLGVAIPLAILSALTRSPYVVGGLLGTLMLMLAHYRWIRAHKKKLAAGAGQAQQADAERVEAPVTSDR